MQEFENNAIYWIDVEKIKPNPFQPRREFNEAHLRDLSESIRQYGVLQPLVLTKREIPHEGGIDVLYELIAGERRLRASKLAGVTKVPAIIKSNAVDNRLKLELAIIENLQREDLNPVDRALAFAKLANEFNFTHVEVAKRVGKSREYVSNTIRLLSLPQDMLDALSGGRISEGHARPLMMLNDRHAEQLTLFKEILVRKLTVREAEEVARHVAHDKVRKKGPLVDPEMVQMAEDLTETMGTRVAIEPRAIGGKVVIDYFSREDLHAIVETLHKRRQDAVGATYGLPPREDTPPVAPVTTPEPLLAELNIPPVFPGGTDTGGSQQFIASEFITSDAVQDPPSYQQNPEEIQVNNAPDEDLYGLKNFSV